MTVIAWDGRTLAADKRATSGGGIARTGWHRAWWRLRGARKPEKKRLLFIVTTYTIDPSQQVAATRAPGSGQERQT